MKSKVINIKNGKVSGGVYIGRGSIFGNPYHIGKDGNRAEVIAKYRVYLWKRVNRDEPFRRAVEGLRDKTLMCYCKPLACHGDVIISYLEWSLAYGEQWGTIGYPLLADAYYINPGKAPTPIV